MAGIIKHFVGSEYPNGDYKLAPEATSGILVGGFVTVDHGEKEFDVPADDAIAEVFFVANEVDWLVPHNVDNRNYLVEAGDYVKAKPVIDGEQFQTTLIGSTYAGISVGDVMGVGADGKLLLIADLTATDFTTFQTVFTVKSKELLWGLEAVTVVANTNQKTA